MDATKKKVIRGRLCPKCKKRFSTPCKTKRQLMAVQIREFKCENCKHTFSRISQVVNTEVQTIAIDNEPMEVLKLPESIKDVDINLDDIDRELLWLNLPNLTEQVPKANLSNKRTKCDMCNLKRGKISDTDWLRLRMCIINQEHYACLDCGKHFCQTKGWESHRLIHVRKK